MRTWLSESRLRHALAGLLLLAALAWWSQAAFFGHELITTIAIFAILGMSLDLVAGYLGLVSLGHAAFFGAGAYLYALATVFWQWSAPAGMLFAVAGCGSLALLIGLVVVRTHGIFFIMITLAFGEIGHEIVFRNRRFGGSDGLTGIPRLDLSAIGIDLANPAAFSLAAIGAAAMVYLLLAYLLNTPFGHALVGTRENERRARAIGITVGAHRVAAFAIAGALAGFAGTLVAQQLSLVTPQLLHWTTSGEILIMTLFGGLGTLAGPALGATILTVLRHELSAITDYWGLWLGLTLVAVVLLGPRGVVGWVHGLAARMAARNSVPQNAAR